MDDMIVENIGVNGKALAVLPVMDIQTALARYRSIVAFVRQVLREGVDYGIVPGTDKATLLKPGAERLCSFFGLAPQFHVVETIEDWTGSEHDGEPFIHYWYKCMLFQSGQFVGEADGSCNSRENKYRWRWVRETDLPAGIDRTGLVTRGGTLTEFQFAIDKAETTGQFGKPAAYWQKFSEAIDSGRARRVTKTTRTGKTMDAWEIDNTLYRLPSDDVASQANTILKMAEKRALTAATLIAVNASEFFTQDMEDLVPAEVVAEALLPLPEPAVAAPPRTSPADAQSSQAQPQTRPQRNAAGSNQVTASEEKVA